MVPKTRIQLLFSPALARSARTMGLLAVAALVALALLATDALAAQAPVGLGTADSFAVLAGSTVTNSGPSTVNGDLGVSPGLAVTGFPPGTVNGTIHAGDAVATQAQSDLTTAYNDAAGRTPPVSVPADLGGLTLTAGVYNNPTSLGLTGTLTLDAQGDPNAVFVFQAGSTLITASGSHVNLINGAQPCNVYWQVGSSATLGTSSVFTGNILALTSISVNDGVTVAGRALARNGAVTLINDTITAAHCAPPATPPPTTPPPATPPPSTPPPSTPPPTATAAGSPVPVVSPPVSKPAVSKPPGTPKHRGTARLTTTPASVGRTVTRFGVGRSVRGTFGVRVTGRFIRRVVFRLDGRRIGNRRTSPFAAVVRSRRGIHRVTARITFTDGTHAVTRTMRFRTRTAVTRRVHHGHRSPSRRPRGPGGFTG